MEHNPHGQQHEGDIALDRIAYSKMGNTAYREEIAQIRGLIQALRDDNMRLEGELAVRDATIARMLRDQQIAKEGRTLEELRNQVTIPIGPGPVTDAIGVPIADFAANPGYVGELTKPEPDPSSWEAGGGTSGGAGASGSWGDGTSGQDRESYTDTQDRESYSTDTSSDTSCDTSSSDSGSSDCGSSGD